MAKDRTAEKRRQRHEQRRGRHRAGSAGMPAAAIPAAAPAEPTSAVAPSTSSSAPAPDVVVEADFLADLRAGLRAFLATYGIDVPADADTFYTCMIYANCEQKRIAARPRAVRPSTELAAKTLAPEVAAVVDEIAALAKKGRDLTPYLSRGIVDGTVQDGLLNDWGIHHLHVDPQRTCTDGFAPRGDLLLFVYVQPDDIYFIDVLPHGAWSKRRLLYILCGNWPKLTARWRLNGLSAPLGVPPEQCPTEEEIAQARKHGVTPITAMPDGSMMMPPGGGITCNRWNVRVRDRADRLMDEVEGMERWCRSRAGDIADAVAMGGGPKLARLHLRLRLGARGFEVVDEPSGIRIGVPPGAVA